MVHNKTKTIGNYVLGQTLG